MWQNFRAHPPDPAHKFEGSGAVDAVCLTLQYFGDASLEKTCAATGKLTTGETKLQGAKPLPEKYRVSRLLYLGWVWI